MSAAQRISNSTLIQKWLVIEKLQGVSLRCYLNVSGKTVWESSRGLRQQAVQTSLLASVSRVLWDSPRCATLSCMLVDKQKYHRQAECDILRGSRNNLGTLPITAWFFFLSNQHLAHLVHGTCRSGLSVKIFTHLVKKQLLWVWTNLHKLSLKPGSLLCFQYIFLLPFK